jgi:hypothetical protein
LSIPAYPLAWPAGWKRTPAHGRTGAKFKHASRPGTNGGSWQNQRQLSVADAVARLRKELDIMGIADDDVVISTNIPLRLDGFPRSNTGEPADPGVAIYWTNRHDRSQPPKCMPIDRYDRVADNLAAAAATLEAMRAIERHGGAQIQERAYSGFTALPGPESVDWRSVKDPKDPEGSNRRLRSQHHPDNGGDAAQFQRVQAAIEAWREENGR